MLAIAVVYLSGCQHLDTAVVDSAKPFRLEVQGNVNPLNIHGPAPGLSWRSRIAKQAAYQIQAASTVDLLTSDRADIWDSGRIESRRSLHIRYGGELLSSRDQVYWRVRIWPGDGVEPGPWSDPASWEMGLLSRTDWSAQWVQAVDSRPVTVDEPITHWANLAGHVEEHDGSVVDASTSKLLATTPAQLFRLDFEIEKPVARARLYSSAAGYYEIYLDGRKVSDRVMDPGQTDYDKRILYNADDVSARLTGGHHTLAIQLGSGWYDESVAFSRNGSLSYGQPAAIVQLEIEYQDGSVQTIVTDDQWRSQSSPIIKESLFAGEVYDARREIAHWNDREGHVAASGWTAVRALESWPTETLAPQLQPPVRAVRPMAPVRMLNPRPGVWVYDFGQNFTGIPTLAVADLGLPVGSAVFLRYAEWADDHGNISQKSGGGFATLVNQVDAYISNGRDEGTWTPTFTWHGFRYVELSGVTDEPPLSALSAHLVRSDVPRTGTFVSSDPLLNRIHETALWSYESNLISVPMDCPIRERGGWTGDAHASLVTANYNFGMGNFWEKYLGDFRTSRFVAPAIVPGKRSLGLKLDWAVAEVFIAWENFQHSGNEGALHEQYESLIEYMTFGESEMTDWLIANGYGDWCDPVRHPGTARVGGRGTPQHTAVTITSTALFARAADLMSQISRVVGRQADERRFEVLFRNIAREFHAAFYDQESGHYGSQTADGMALSFGLVPEALRQSVADALNKDVLESWGGHSSVGALGQTWLYLALSDYGHENTALGVFEAPGYPGFQYLFDTLGGTTLWERKGAFDPQRDGAPARSLNHPFHSGYDAWFYQGLGGIRPNPDSPGFQDFVLKPVFPEKLQSVDVTYESGYGLIESQWHRSGGIVDWRVVIPPNSTAKIYLPGRPAQDHGAGQYTFRIGDDE